jgi:hypothetical protein
MEFIEQRATKLLSQLTRDKNNARIGSCWMYILQANMELDSKEISDTLYIKGVRHEQD